MEVLKVLLEKEFGGVTDGLGTIHHYLFLCAHLF